MKTANPSEAVAESAEAVAPSLRLLDYYFVLRPTLMFPLMTMVLAGDLLASGHTGLSSLRWTLVVVALVTLFGLIYLINQLADRAADRRNGKLFLVADGALPSKHIHVEMAILALLSPVALFLAGLGHLALLLVLMFLLAGVLYNVGPIALSRQPWGGIASGVLGGWMLIRFGDSLLGTLPSIGKEMPYVIAFGCSAILTNLLDEPGDSEAGRVTFTVRYGARITMAAAAIGIALALIWGAVNRDLIVAISAAASLPLLIRGWWRSQPSDAVTANKIAILLLSVLVGVHFPLYLVAILLHYFVSRWYYRRRFGMDYPNLRGS